MTSENKKQDAFTGKYGFIAAAAGSASGLENIWKFPYITGVYGGSAFIIVYLICILLIGIPSSLSFGALSDFSIFGDNIFDLFGHIASNVLMPEGGLCVSLFVGWQMAKSDVEKELPTTGNSLCHTDTVPVPG